MKVTKTNLKHAVTGGTILGGGGGGSMSRGLEVGMEALNKQDITLLDINKLQDDDLILCVSSVGAPAAVDKQATSQDYVRTVELYKQYFNQDIKGIITNENGGTGTVNGWIQSAYLNIPVIDAACNGRAHPTGAMGSLNLHKFDDYVSKQVAIGGKKELNNYLELSIKGSLDNAAKETRHAAVRAGGLVAVARNAVSVKYLKEQGAVNAISQAIELGKTYHEGLAVSNEQCLKNILNYLNGEVITTGKVEEYSLETTGGFDVGYLTVNGYKVTLWNEYMSVEKDGERLHTFPDLIMTLDAKTMAPVTSAEIILGQEVVLFVANKQHLKLSKTMFEQDMLADIEDVLKIDIYKYL